MAVAQPRSTSAEKAKLFNASDNHGVLTPAQSRGSSPAGAAAGSAALHICAPHNLILAPRHVADRTSARRRNGRLVLARADFLIEVGRVHQAQDLIKSGNPANITSIIASPLMIQLALTG